MSFEDLLAERVYAATDLTELAASFEALVLRGVEFGPDDRVTIEKGQVGTLGELRIVVYPDEHAPPHFHIVGHGINASFTIADCAPLRGTLEPKHSRQLKWWYPKARDRLVAEWNRMRPTDCQAGGVADG